MRSEKQKLANYTELVHAGEGVTIEKGVISASGGGSGGSGGGLIVLSESDGKLSYNGAVINRNQFEELYNNNAILFFRWETNTNSFFGYVNSYDTVEYNITVIVNSYNLGNDISEWVRWTLYYNSTDDYWYTD